MSEQQEPTTAEVGQSYKRTRTTRGREPSQYETAQNIADQLGETDEARREYIGHIVWALGRTQSRRVLKETLDLTRDGSSAPEEKSTPVEIFFRLAQTRGKPKPGKPLRPFGPSLSAAEQPISLSYTTIAREIAERLNEREAPQQQQIMHIVWALGPAQAQSLMQEAIELDAGSGMLTPDGERRRTVGGIFFYLVYSKGIPEAGRTLKRSHNEQKRPNAEPTTDTPSKQVAQPQSLPLFTWGDRIVVIREAETGKGQTSVKITLVGRPGKIIDRGTCIVTVMESTKVPALPKGLPMPANTTTKYAVYISSKQWKKVSEAITDPEDVLIVEGFPTIDPQTSSIAVFATNTTTKKLQMAQKVKPQTSSS